MVNITLVTPDQIESYLKANDRIRYTRLPDITQDPRRAIGNVIHRVEILAAPLGEPHRIESIRDLCDRVKFLNDVLDGLAPGLSSRSPPSRPFSVHPDDFGYGAIVDFGYLCLEQIVGADTINRTITINDGFNGAAGFSNGNSSSDERSVDLRSLVFVRLFPYWDYAETVMRRETPKIIKVEPPLFLNNLSVLYWF